MTTDILLYDYWRSSAAYRLRIALNLLGLRYTAVPVNLLSGEHRAPDHLARNPQGLVPALWIDGMMLTQSLAILDYLDETRGGLLPSDPSARQRARALAQAIAVDIHPICNLRVMRHAVAQSDGAISDASWMRHFIGLGLSAVDSMIDGPDYCIGAAVSVADLCLVPQIYNARRWGLDPAAFPRCFAVADRLARLPAFAAAAPEAVGPPPAGGRALLPD